MRAATVRWLYKAKCVVKQAFFWGVAGWSQLLYHEKKGRGR